MSYRRKKEVEVIVSDSCAKPLKKWKTPQITQSAINQTKSGSPWNYETGHGHRGSKPVS